MTTIGERIRKRREQLGMSQEDLAHKIGYKSKSSINKIELDVQQLRQSKIKQIAQALETTTDYVMGWDEPPSDAKNPRTRTATVINVLGHVAAGIPIEAITDIVDTEEISEELARCGEYFGLKIKGNSMEPKIKDGDTVIVRRQDDAESDEIVIAIVNGNDGVCKRLKKYDGKIALVSENPAYEPMYYENVEVAEIPVRIAGKVVELRRKF